MIEERSAGVILFNKTDGIQFLILKYPSGHWDFVKGNIEEGEKEKETVKRELFEETGILTKHEFKGGKARYEELSEGHHDHLIDIKSGEIIEFVDDEIEKLQKKVAEKYGYELVDHKLELYGVKKKS